MKGEGKRARFQHRARLFFERIRLRGVQHLHDQRQSERWDGCLDGKDAPADVYAYVMQVRFPNGDREELKGDVTLRR
jgi:hypothetical protein